MSSQPNHSDKFEAHVDELRESLDIFGVKLRKEPLMEAHQQAITAAEMGARVDENEYWREVSKAFQRGILSSEFRERKAELAKRKAE